MACTCFLAEDACLFPNLSLAFLPSVRAHADPPAGQPVPEGAARGSSARPRGHRSLTCRVTLLPGLGSGAPSPSPVGWCPGGIPGRRSDGSDRAAPSGRKGSPPRSCLFPAGLRRSPVPSGWLPASSLECVPGWGTWEPPGPPRPAPRWPSAVAASGTPWRRTAYPAARGEASSARRRAGAGWRRRSGGAVPSPFGTSNDESGAPRGLL